MYCKGDNMTQHIDNDTLNRYIKMSLYSDGLEGSSQDHGVLDHLAICNECRDQASVMTLLHQEGQIINQPSSLDKDQQQLICDYVDGHLTAKEQQQAKDFINNQPDAMRAALHYQSHIEGMNLHVPIEEKTIKSETGNPLNWIGQLFNFQSPLIYTMAATAALFIAILSISQIIELEKKPLMIASYQDNPTLQFTDNNRLPGIGFFTQSTNSSIPFDDIKIELLENNVIKMSWPVIKGAAQYKIRIQVFNKGNKTLLKEQQTETNHTTFKLAPIPIENQDQESENMGNKRYEWVLYGNTIDDRMFYASGGFVVATVETEDTSW